LKESNIELFNLTHGFALDIGGGITESVVELNSILDEYITIPFRREECIYEMFGKAMRN
jgi:hypothetical protein